MKWDDQRVETIIGELLKAGVLLSAAIVFIGGIFYFQRHGAETPQYKIFRGEPPQFSTLTGLFDFETLKHPRGVIMLGLIVLILTPVARVAFSLIAFALERDWLYVIVTSIVLGLLSYSLLSA